MKILKHLLACACLMLCMQVHAQTQLQVGETAPGFVANDQNGNSFDLQAALKDGPVIISFYRGSWCPYCMKQLKEVQSRYSEISGKDAQFIAVTPDKASGVEKTVNLIKPNFKIIRDGDLNISHIYKAISEETFESFDGESSHSRKYLPVPATYVIGQDGKIIFSYFDANYRVRAHFDEMVESLK